MTTVGRLAGAILVQDGERYFLVGDTKEPLNYSEFGFCEVKDRDVVKQPVVGLTLSGGGDSLNSRNGIKNPEPSLMVAPGDGATVAEILGRTLVIRRNGSVSERLWNLVLESSPSQEEKAHIQWLCETPEPIWEIVRDTVLRCS